jgi:hypothetical protein
MVDLDPQMMYIENVGTRFLVNEKRLYMRNLWKVLKKRKGC